MSHVVLLGDSIFDNGVYNPGAPAVIDQVRQSLPADWSATLCAVDGARTGDVAAQLERLPRDASHLILSVGGNDALSRAAFLQQPAHSVAEVLAGLSELGLEFGANYVRALGGVIAWGKPVVACTIYYPRFSDPTIQNVTVAALSVFNDAIIRVAVRHGLPLIDLRLICSEYGDYANDIEPSSQGGAKIAATIARVVREHDFEKRGTCVYAEPRPRLF
jgi:lysophospholipase L1-like esterase